MTDKLRVVVSRHWDRPQITVTVNHEKIELFASIDSFREALLTELGPPWKLFTRHRLRRKMERAFVDIIEKVKEASSQVM
jgi:hypothetical protein